ncbi:MAG: hypothetical protein ABF679_09960 [Lentilactobacillus diolivorans]
MRVERKAVTWQEVAFWRTFPFGNNRDYTKRDWDKSNFVPVLFIYIYKQNQQTAKDLAKLALI